MKISELQPRQGNIEIEAEVIDKGEARTFEKFGKEGRVCNAKIKDDSGEIKLSLWNEQVDQVNVGSKVKLTNGYVSEFQGEMQLSTGKFGSLEIVSGNTEDHGEHILSEDEKTEAEALNKEIPEPAPEEEVTKDELEETDLKESKKIPENPASEENVDVEEEKVE